MAAQNEVLPVSSSRVVDGLDNFTRVAPASAMNVLQYSVRAGKNSDKVLGYIKKISWSVKRKTKEIYQIEALPDTIFDEPSAVDLTQAGQYFTRDVYFPGEPVEIVPGFQDPIMIELERTVMNGGTGLEALLNAGDAAEYNNYNNGAGYPPFVQPNTGNRGINPLQQVRPLTITSICYSPTQVRNVIYGVRFIDCWIEDVTGWDIGTDGEGVIVEKISMKCPKIRLFNPPPSQ
jgi:hypothetical protein